jgi:hypothetical protein
MYPAIRESQAAEKNEFGSKLRKKTQKSKKQLSLIYMF